MKKIFFIIAVILLSVSTYAQTNTNKQTEKVTKYVTTFPNGEEAITITDRSESDNRLPGFFLLL